MSDLYIPKRALICMAHPDDPEFSSGGLTAIWTAAGAEVFYAVLTNGNKGSDDPIMTPLMLAEMRQAEQRAAAEILGVKEVRFLGYNDGELVPSLELRRDIVHLVRRLRPDTVITHDPFRRIPDNRINHPDHVASGQATLDALFPAAGNRMYHPELILEGLQPHEVSRVFLAGSLEFNLKVDITEVLSQKIAAIKFHKSQVKDPDGLEERMRMRAEADGRFYENYRQLILRS